VYILKTGTIAWHMAMVLLALLGINPSHLPVAARIPSSQVVHAAHREGRSPMTHENPTSNTTNSAATEEERQSMPQYDELQLQGLRRAIPYLLQGRSPSGQLNWLAGMWCQEAAVLGVNGGDSLTYDFPSVYYQILQKAYDLRDGSPVSTYPGYNDPFSTAVVLACPGRLFAQAPSG
jgi:hypothetical protein